VNTAADDGGMTSTRQVPARFVTALTTCVVLALFAAACGSDKKASTAATTTTAATANPNDGEYCQTARTWTVHEFNGGGNGFAEDPVAFEKYWGDWMTFIATATRQAPPELRDDWAVAYAFQVKQFTPILEKYDFDIERAQAEGSPAELAVGQRVDGEPTPAEQRARDTVVEYENRVCDTGQPPAADVSFAGATPNQAYCDAVNAANELAEEVEAEKWSVDAVRALVTSDELTALLDKAKKNAPAEIKADVEADADWQANQQVDVLEKFGYDARKLMLEGTHADRAIFQRSDPAIAGHYARTIAYEEQVCQA
jgi:hypothetical protein